MTQALNIVMLNRWTIIFPRVKMDGMAREIKEELVHEDKKNERGKNEARKCHLYNWCSRSINKLMANQV